MRRRCYSPDVAVQSRRRRIADRADNGLIGLKSWYDAPRSSLAWVMDTPVSVRVSPPCVMEVDEKGTAWSVSQERATSRVCGCGAMSSATCSFERCAPYLHRSSGTGEYADGRRRGGEYVL